MFQAIGSHTWSMLPPKQLAKSPVLSLSLSLSLSLPSLKFVIVATMNIQPTVRGI